MEHKDIIVTRKKENVWKTLSKVMIFGTIATIMLNIFDWKSYLGEDSFGLHLVVFMLIFIGIILVSAFISLESHKYTFCDDCIYVETSKKNFLILPYKTTQKIQFHEIASIAKKTIIVSLFSNLDRFIRITYNKNCVINITERDTFTSGNKNIDYDLFAEEINNYLIRHSILTVDDCSEEDDSFFEEGTELFIDENGHFVDANGNQFDENDHDIDSNGNQLNEKNHIETSKKDEDDFEIPLEMTFGTGRMLWSFFCLFVSLFGGYQFFTYLSLYITTGKVDSKVATGIGIFLIFSGETYRQFFGKQ